MRKKAKIAVAAEALIIVALLAFLLLLQQQPPANGGQKWSLYNSPTYGFSIEYPPDWGLEREANISGYGGTLKEVVEFGPNNSISSNRPLPLKLQVIEATAEQYQTYYPRFTLFGKSEQEPAKHFYTFKILETGRRIVMVDSSAVVGNSDAEIQAMKETIEEMIQTLKPSG